MEDLKILVEKLEQEHDEKEQVKILQKIEEKLLNEYVIKIGNDTIEPLRVEAYYYPAENKEKFNDPCAHESVKKINNFGKLYFIEPKYGYPGIDLCLSLGNYYLSFLIKDARIGDTIFKQTALHDKFKNKNSEIENMDVLKKTSNKQKTVFYTSRVGINSEKTKFAHELLAAVIDIHNDYDWETGYAKEWTVANYLAANAIEPTDENIKKYLGYNSAKVKEYYTEMKNK